MRMVDTPKDSEPHLRYAWRGNGVLEVEAQAASGTPAIGVVDSGSARGGRKSLLHVRLAGQPCAAGGSCAREGLHLRLPAPFNLGAVHATSTVTCKGVRETQAVERRIDPDDGLFYTFAELQKKYAGEFAAADIEEFWDEECEGVEEWRQPKAGPAPLAVWEVQAGHGWEGLSPAATLSSQAATLTEGLCKSGWGVVDGFLRGAEADALHLMVREWWSSGRLRAAHIGTGLHSPNHRGDLSAVCEQGSLPAAARLAQDRINSLVSHFAKFVPELKDGVECEPPMFALYPGDGTRYVKHFDCLEGEVSEFSKQRICTIILYLNPFWCEEHGGKLRLYPEEGRSFVDVEPFHGRLLAFLCEGRNAHEVLPAWRNRFACTWWVREAEASLDPWDATM